MRIVGCHLCSIDEDHQKAYSIVVDAVKVARSIQVEGESGSAIRVAPLYVEIVAITCKGRI
jgi:hypothetical protein